MSLGAGSWHQLIQAEEGREAPVESGAQRPPLTIGVMEPEAGLSQSVGSVG